MKKPHLLKIITPPNLSFVLKDDTISWQNPWHYHPEIELLYCLKGQGTNFIGNTILPIEEGELLLIGSNVPHTRQRDKSFYENNPNIEPKSIVVQFKEDFLGKDFFQTLEMKPILELLTKAKRGLKFTNLQVLGIDKKLIALEQKEPTMAIIGLLEILFDLTKSDHVAYLNSPMYATNVYEKYGQRINQVYEYTISNFKNQIKLSEVAAITNTSETAFCKQFKKITRKSYFQYLSEVRIGYACSLLSDKQKDIAQIAFESGYNNLSNFNKQFKAIMKMTPRDYQNQTKIIV